MKTIYKIILFLLLLISAQLHAQVPQYNSYPSAEAVLFLDFDGHTVEGTSWNYDGPIVCDGSNLPTEKITEIFNRIAEDYRPFNVNVTTDSIKYLAAPVTKRMRALFTTSHGWYGSSAGGVAFVNSFSWGDGTPCFIFTALFNYNVKYIAEAGAHEIGHSLGLSHQATYDANCVKTSDYHYGAGTGETGWAPIMGVGYYKNFTVWHNGPDPYGCNNTQTDLSIITGTTNGFGFRTDEHSNTTTGATATNFTNNQFVVNGVVAKTDDIDVFKFTIPENGRFELEAVPYNVGTGNTGSDLDLQIDLADNTNTVIGAYNPGNALSSIVDTVLPAGTYYIKVDGKGNQFTSEYGSLGSYSLRGTYTMPLPLHKLELKGISEKDKHNLQWLVQADEAIVKQVLQVSENGRTFTTLSTPASHQNSFHYTPQSGKNLYYRISITFDNGRQYYSNIILLKNENLVKPELLTNLIRTNELVINCPDNYTYTLLDLNGRQLANGTINKGASTLMLPNISNGSYILHFKNGSSQFVEKFVKQ